MGWGGGGGGGGGGGDEIQPVFGIGESASLTGKTLWKTLHQGKSTSLRLFSVHPSQLRGFVLHCCPFVFLMA